MTPQELIAYIEGLIIDNTTQQISPYKMRSVLVEMVNSLNQSNISSLSAVLPLNYDPFTNVLSLPVVNNLTAGGTNAVLSAEQGKILKQLIDDLVIGGGGIPEAPIDGVLYGRKDAGWIEVVGLGVPTLQEVTDVGTNTTNPISVTDVANDKVTGVNGNLVSVADLTTSETTALESDGISFINPGGASGVKLKSSSQTGNVGELLIPDVGLTSKTIATTDEIPSIVGLATETYVDDGLDLKENSANKSNDLGDAASTTKFPVWAIISTYITNALASFKTANFLDFTSSGQTQLNDKADKDSTFPMRLQFSASSPLDNTTYYVGGSNNLILSTTNNRFVYAGITASSFRLSIFLYNNGTLGTSENSTIKLLNVTQGTNIVLTTTAKFNSASYGFVGNFIFAVTEGDALALEINCPAFATNPTNVIGGANLILKK